MTLIDRTSSEEPWRFDFFAVLRRLERSYPGPAAHRRQRGAARRIRRARPGPLSWTFPASNLEQASSATQHGPLARLRQVPRPARAAGRAAAGDHRGSLRLDADARRRVPALPRYPQPPLPAAVLPGLGGLRGPIAQHDRPEDDRFIAYVGAMIGIGSRPYRDLDFRAGRRQARLRRADGAAGQVRVAPARA